jgi:DNA-binding NtrC family response regulator
MKILLVDDEPNLVRTLGRILERKGHTVATAGDGKAALASLAANGAPDVVITDLMMPVMDGLELLGAMAESHPDVPVIVLTGQGTVTNAVEAMKLGAYDYLVKPCNPDEILIVLDRVSEVRSLRREVKSLRMKVRKYEPEGDLIGDSRGMRELRKMIGAVAPKRATVLISGESGTGKELVAREIRRLGPAPECPFIAINCGALSDTLLESQLFGHRKGSFTGAISDHEGFFRAAEGGILFLDEISEMPMPLQVKLLRAVQYREVIPIGATSPDIVDTRIVAATNQNLEEAVAKGKFREDLYYRLNVVNLHIPPLRDRDSDVAMLVRHFIGSFARTYEVAPKEVEPEAMELLVKYGWPGNVRELQNVIERAFVLSDEPVLTLRELEPKIRIGSSGGGRMAPLTAAKEPETLADVEKLKIIDALRRANGRKIEAARILGIDRKRLYRKIRKYEIVLDGVVPKTAAAGAQAGGSDVAGDEEE